VLQDRSQPVQSGGLTRQAFQTECRYTKNYYRYRVQICTFIQSESATINSVFLKLCRRPILENFVPYIAQMLLNSPKSVKSITLKSSAIIV